jgi:hypothetical protein
MQAKACTPKVMLQRLNLPSRISCSSKASGFSVFIAVTDLRSNSKGTSSLLSLIPIIPVSSLFIWTVGGRTSLALLAQTKLRAASIAIRNVSSCNGPGYATYLALSSCNYCVISTKLNFDASVLMFVLQLVQLLPLERDRMASDVDEVGSKEI